MGLLILINQAILLNRSGRTYLFLIFYPIASFEAELLHLKKTDL
jgi:hypothetical protein